jgi:hypothetical protein
MPTVSAYTSEELKAQVDRVSREEGRRAGQVGNTALELYVSLPSAARRALLELSASAEAGPEAWQQAITDMSRALLNARWELATRRVTAEAAERGELPDEATEDEIAALAVEMVAREPSR